LRVNGTPYRGINVLMLWGEAWSKDYNNPTWMTFQQAKEFGACVRKGEHGSLVVYANRVTKIETTPEGEDVERSIPFLRGYSVFNCEQIDGLPARFVTTTTTAPIVQPAFERVAQAESFVGNTGANISHGGNQAFFMPSQDRIQLPPFAAFRDAESYYATLLHELTHWTHGTGRLVREFGRRRWGDEGYAAEELVAELGAAFLCADLQIAIEPRADHASYIALWLRVLKNDKRAIFTAASYAQAAADYLHQLQPGAADQPQDDESELAIAA
jgi:antirestriction protein ArdC